MIYKLLLVIILFNISCSAPDLKDRVTKADIPVDENNIIDSVKKSEPIKKETPKHKSTCNFINPDTSLINISFGDGHSTESALGDEFQLVGDSTNIYLSKDEKTYVSFITHPGSGYNSIYEFEVGYRFHLPKDNYKRIPFKEFYTEKNIKLGIEKKKLILKLGNCFEITDSTDDRITLKYSISSPNDSQTNFLNKLNMPFYYANYYFVKNKLIKFQFGFEYP